MNNLPKNYIESPSYIADSIALKLFGKRKRVISEWYLKCVFSLDDRTANTVCKLLRTNWRYKIDNNTSFSNYATAKYHLYNFAKHLKTLPFYKPSF
jgi:hypothetical protein